MKNSMLVVFAAASLGIASDGFAVEYVKICNLYGAGFNYVPGTDICWNSTTGDARQETEGGIWRSLLPYPEGEWVTKPRPECPHGKYVDVGTFKSTDFTLNAWNRKQTPSVNTKLKSDEFISKVIMSGGFFDPRLPERHATNGLTGLCLRSIDPNVIEQVGEDSYNPPFGNDKLPIGCVANSRIVNMPAAYMISATSAFPSVDAFFNDAEQTVSGPYTYGSKLVVTTDFGSEASTQLTYFDVNTETRKPMAGKLSVGVCVEKGKK